MSNLNSKFDILRGWPNGSALVQTFAVDPTTEQSEGDIVKTESDQLPDAKVLKMVSDADQSGSPPVGPSLGDAYVVNNWGVGYTDGNIVEYDGSDWNVIVSGAADYTQLDPAAVLNMISDADQGGSPPVGPSAGDAYEVNNWGVGYTDGDIVEYDGAAWQVIVTNSGGNPPDGTRAVVKASGAAGSFSGDEETIQVVSSGTWSVDDTPTPRDRVLINGSGGVYENNNYIYIGAHPAGSWNLHVSDVANGTRVVVTDSGAAGSFSGDEEKIYAYNNTTLAWAAVTTPARYNRIRITGVSSIYEGKYFDYANAAHPTGAWVRSAQQYRKVAKVTALTSAVKSGNNADDAWVVIQGDDQFDGSFVGKVTCLKLKRGGKVKIPTTIANTLSPGDYVHANAGALAKTSSGGGMQYTIGQVVASNATAGSEGWVVIAS